MKEFHDRLARSGGPNRRPDPRGDMFCREDLARMLAPVGGQGAELPLALGCSGLMREPSRRRRQVLLSTAFNEGIVHFDAARMYGLGRVECELGRFAASRRPDVFIATKFGLLPDRTSRLAGWAQAPGRRLLAHTPMVRERVRQTGIGRGTIAYDATTARASLERSLRELKSDYVDLLLIHEWSGSDGNELEETYSVLDDMRQKGYVRAWGVSGSYEHSLTIFRAAGGRCVMQTRDELWRRLAGGVAEHTADIAFGVVGGAAKQVEQYIRDGGGAQREWSEALGLDGAVTSEVARWLVCEAVDAYRGGRVVVGSISPQHVKELCRAVMTMDPGAINEFRRLVGAMPVHRGV